MIEFTLHPQVHATGQNRGLIGLLERAWVKEHTPGDGHMILMSGFGNYNGGVRFYDVFKRHTDNGGRLTAIFGGSTSQRLTSRQVVTQLLECGADVRLINRKRILHAKCYGTESHDENRLVVTSGNFTGPGMSQNIEASVFLDAESTKQMSFGWGTTLESFYRQKWQIFKPSLAEPNAPAWRLLYDEVGQGITLDETEDVTMFLILSHADTARIQADRGSTAGLGSQYFFLSKDSYDFFPPLTILNNRGSKRTYSTLVNMHYLDLGLTDPQCRVTFEAENNLDFRLGTGFLRYTKVAAAGDLAAISRIGHDSYQLRIFRKGTAQFEVFSEHAITFIGAQGKKFGYLPNEDFEALLETGDPPHESARV